MKPFDIALFKHFIEGKAMVTIYINLYKKYKHKRNPALIEDFLKEVLVEDACTTAFYWVANSNYGYDYWMDMQKQWMEFYNINKDNYTADDWWKLQGMSKILRTNWDAVKHWRQESRKETAIRMGIPLEKLGLDSDEKKNDVTVPTEHDFSDVPEYAANNGLNITNPQPIVEADAEEEKHNDEHVVDVLGGFNFVDLTPRRQLKPFEVSINRRNKKHSITFNQTLSKEIRERGGYEYAALMRNKAGDVVLMLNDAKGVAMLDGRADKEGGNCVINNKELVSRIAVFLDLKTDYVIANVKELQKTDDYVAYLVTNPSDK